MRTEGDFFYVRAIAESIINYGYQLLHQYHANNHLLPAERLNSHFHARMYDLFERVQHVDFLYHYTSVKSCYEMLSSDDIFLFEAQKMNDAVEGKFGREIMQSLSHFYANYHPSNLFLYRDEIDAYGIFGNQSFDYAYHPKSVKKVNRYLQQVKFHPSSLMFLFSLSDPVSFEVDGRKEAPYENLNMWVAYGRNGKGICIEFYKSDLAYRCGRSLNVLPVLYDYHSQYLFFRYLYRMLHDLIHKNDAIIYAIGTWASTLTTLDMASYLRKMKSFQSLVNEVMKIYISIAKHPCFAGENEWRLIYQCLNKKSSTEINWLKTETGKFPYVPFSSLVSPERKGAHLLPVKRIILGPTLTKSEKENFFKQCKEIIETRGLEILDSSLPYQA